MIMACRLPSLLLWNKSNLIGVDLFKNNEINTKTDIIKNIHSNIKSNINVIYKPKAAK